MSLIRKGSSIICSELQDRLLQNCEVMCLYFVKSKEEECEFIGRFITVNHNDPVLLRILHNQVDILYLKLKNYKCSKTKQIQFVVSAKTYTRKRPTLPVCLLNL